MSQYLREQIRQVGEKFRANGLRWTEPRRTVVEVLVSSAGRHPTAAEIYRIVRQRYPKIGRATVYRTLDLLEKLGIIRHTFLQRAVPGYVFLHQGTHVHVICRKCEKVLELPDVPTQEILPQVQTITDFIIEGGVFELYGMCKSCQTQS